MGARRGFWQRADSRRAARGGVELPAPGVVFAPDFLARLGRLTARLASQRERREGDGRARLFGVGPEFVGFRPYRSGEDLRALDWNLLARLGRPYVRVAAREASEEWAVLLDTSASMGLGSPGKLQLAAELATALAAVGVARRARVELFLSGSLSDSGGTGSSPSAPSAQGSIRKRAGLASWMRTLAALSARGSEGLGSLARVFARPRAAGRVFLIGDFLDCEPRDVLSLARPSRELFLAQILAREELVPPEEEAVRWVDAESGASRTIALEGDSGARYERRLGLRLEGWRAAARRARTVHGLWTSATPFEQLVDDLCARGG